MPDRIRQIAVDTFQINLPWSLSFATINIANLKEWVSITAMAIGTICTVLVTIKKLKGRDKE